MHLETILEQEILKALSETEPNNSQGRILQAILVNNHRIAPLQESLRNQTLAIMQHQGIISLMTQN